MTNHVPNHIRHKRVHIARRGVIYSLILCAVILLFGGFGFWLLDPMVETLPDGLWLAFTTAATVGYGDLVPSTHASRMFSVLVVLLGWPCCRWPPLPWQRSLLKKTWKPKRSTWSTT